MNSVEEQSEQSVIVPMQVAGKSPKSAEIPLYALVGTELGEGFVFGRSRASAVPMFDIRLMDGKMCASYANRNKRPVVSTVTLIDRCPIDHPKFPSGMKALLKPPGVKPVQVVSDERPGGIRAILKKYWA
jgi:hypothetical protein